MTDVDEAPTPVLPRELTGIFDAVREVAAPPTPALAEPYRIRLVDPDADAVMISEWMNRPHLVEASEYAWPPARWQQYLRTQLEGEYSRPFICSFRGGDFGYIELYRAAKDSIAPRYDADPHDVALHAAIAELKFRQQGDRADAVAAPCRQCLRARAPMPANHVRPRSPQQRCAPAVRILRLRLPRRARHVEPPDGALRIAARPAERSAARDQGS
jgi:hypothetical protein